MFSRDIKSILFVEFLYQQRQQPQPAATSGDSNMKTMMKMIADMMKGQINELKQMMEVTNQNLQNQIGQMANELN